jgi:hypothetical protein
MEQNLAPVVKDAVANTPIWMVDDPYVALRGLLLMPGDGAKKKAGK